jgi:glucosamine--fructose-6-phosphate aminotransferase (isomerizing)
MEMSNFLERIKSVVVKQPEYLEKTIESSWNVSEEISESLLKRNISQVLLTGCGDSFFAGIAGKYMFRAFSDFTVFVEESLELAKYTKCTEKTVVVAFSASGRTARTLEAVRKAKGDGAQVVAITNEGASPIARISDYTILTKVEEAFGSPTATSTTAMAACATLALWLGGKNGFLSDEEFEKFKEEIFSLPMKAKEVMSTRNMRQNMEAAEKFSVSEHVHLAGGGPCYASALFGMAKMKELAWIHSEAVELEEFCHVQMFPIEKDTPVIVFAHSGKSFNRAIQVLNVLKKIGVLTYVVSNIENKGLRELSDYQIKIPEVYEALVPVINIIPLHFLAIHLAIERKITLEGFRYQDLITELIGYED